MKDTLHIYGNRDPRELPIYGVAAAARYLRLSPATLRSWVVGRTYDHSDGGTGFSEPLIQRPDHRDQRLSFINLVEAHVLHAIRTKHRVPMHKIRTALDYAQSTFGISRLLVREELMASPGNLFLEEFGRLVNISQSGQFAIKRVLQVHLKRLERGPDGLPQSFFPFLGDWHLGKRSILIDPRISFGRPVLTRRSISTAVLTDRFDLGESVEELAQDYDLEEAEVEEAILYERAA
jgi:uncharacterized protein (DUF433 family)